MFNYKAVVSQILDFVRNPESRAAGLLFCVNSIIYTNWTVRMPDFKANLSINEAQIGLSLLASPIGALLFAPIANFLILKHGAGKTSLWSLIIGCFTVLLLGFAFDFYSFAAVLLVSGMALGCLDIAMNATVTAIENKTDKVLMSRAHGFWSTGAMVGSLMGSAFAGLGFSVRVHLIIVTLACIYLLYTQYPVLKPIRFQAENKGKITMPSLRLGLLIVVIFMMFLIEGGIAEWNSLFYDEILDAPSYLWGLGFGVYAFFMAIARFCGDLVLARWSSRDIIIVCAVMVMITLGVFSVADHLIICSVSMAICGVFTSVLVPVVFREAARDEKVSPESGIAMSSIFGYSGFLIGPPLLGFVAHAYGLRMVFGTLSAMTLIVLLVGLSLKKTSKSF
jgi:MFS family permease